MPLMKGKHKLYGRSTYFPQDIERSTLNIGWEDERPSYGGGTREEREERLNNTRRQGAARDTKARHDRGGHHAFGSQFAVHTTLNPWEAHVATANATQRGFSLQIATHERATF